MGVKKKAAKAYLRQVEAEQREADEYISALPWALGFSIGFMSLTAFLHFVRF